MIRAILGTVAMLALAAAAVSAQRARPEAAMAAAARAFLATLTPEQKGRATFAFNDPERLNWHFIPRERKGLPLKEMNPTQRQAALALLRAGLSQRGFEKAGAIRDLEKILRAQEMGRGPVRDPELYFFSVFGTPEESGTWGWRYEGHHCSLNWTVVQGRSIASTPQFFGANPAEVRTAVPDAPPVGTRVLRAEEDLARTLLKSLSAEQKAKAVLSPTAPPDIITGAQRQAAIQENRGIAYRELNSDQQGILLSLIREYADAQPRPLAEQRLEAIRRAGLDEIRFAWMGGEERGQGHYYRVQGRTFLIEYDNTQNNANHIHSVWRDFKGDFGMDLLAMHYRLYPHRAAAR